MEGERAVDASRAPTQWRTHGVNDRVDVDVMVNNFDFYYISIRQNKKR